MRNDCTWLFSAIICLKWNLISACWGSGNGLAGCPLPLSLLCCLSALPPSSSSQAIHSQSSCLSIADVPELPRCWVWGKKEPLTGWKQVVTRRRALWSIRCITGASGTFRLHKQTTQGIGPPSWVPENELQTQDLMSHQKSPGQD